MLATFVKYYNEGYTTAEITSQFVLGIIGILLICSKTKKKTQRYKRQSKIYFNNAGWNIIRND
jgi:hypothetical protein